MATEDESIEDHFENDEEPTVTAEQALAVPEVTATGHLTPSISFNPSVKASGEEPVPQYETLDEISSDDIVEDTAPHEFYLLNEDILKLRNHTLVDAKKHNEFFYASCIKNDRININEFPSYTRLNLPYHQICRLRYKQNWKEYNDQFVKEMITMGAHQANAYETARFSRVLCYTTLWPPLHTRYETKRFLKNYFVHTPKDKARLSQLLNDRR